MANTEQVIERIHTYVRLNNWSKNQLAKEAGLPESTLRKFYSTQWNPTLNILRRLEAVIPREFNN